MLSHPLLPVGLVGAVWLILLAFLWSTSWPTWVRVILSVLIVAAGTACTLFALYVQAVRQMR